MWKWYLSDMKPNFLQGPCSCSVKTSCLVLRPNLLKLLFMLPWKVRNAFESHFKSGPTSQLDRIFKLLGKQAKKCVNVASKRLMVQFMISICFLRPPQRSGCNSSRHAEGAAGFTGAGCAHRQGGKCCSQTGGHDQLQTGHSQKDWCCTGGPLTPFPCINIDSDLCAQIFPNIFLSFLFSLTAELVGRSSWRPGGRRERQGPAHWGQEDCRHVWGSQRKRGHLAIYRGDRCHDY